MSVVVDRGSVRRFDRFLSEHPWRSQGVPWPMELYVDLHRRRPGRISVWTPPTRHVKATPVGRLSGAGIDAYDAVLAGQPKRQVTMAMFTAKGGLMLGYRDATVSGLPDDWDIPHPDLPPAGLEL